MTTNGSRNPDPPEIALRARRALERVCSGKGLDLASKYYAPHFIDHVNDLEFHGLAAAERSVSMYKDALSDLEIRVEEQSVDGDRVTSRFVVTGTSYGRRVRFHGITVSRFVDGLIVEDWSVTDSLGMLRQLGLWRSVVMGVRTWRSMAKSKQRDAPVVKIPETAGRPARAS